MKNKRLIRGAVSAVDLGFVVVGIVLAVVGFAVMRPMHLDKSLPGMFKDLGLMPDMLVTNIGIFLGMYPVIKSFFVAPLAQAIHERDSSLEQTFGEAESLRTRMTEMKSEYEKRLAETEADARQRIQAQIKEAQELRKTLMAEASSKADEMVKRAQEEIAVERDRAIGGIRLYVANLTLQATEKVLSENMDNDRNRRLIDEFLDKVEVPTA